MFNEHLLICGNCYGYYLADLNGNDYSRDRASVLVIAGIA